MNLSIKQQIIFYECKNNAINTKKYECLLELLALW